MTPNELIKIASAAYPDELIATEYWNFRRECPRRNPKGGDTLALFIANEIADTYDPDASDEAQINTVLNALAAARGELDTVSEAFAQVLKKPHEQEART